MATLIICPICETRYETKAAFPPEGRKVRCSKCGHVWQAQPVLSSPEPAPAVAAPSPGTFAPQPSPAPKPKAKPAPAGAGVGMGGFTSTQPTPPPEPSLSERLTKAEGDAEFDGGEDLAAQVAQINADAMAEPPPPQKSGGIFGRLAARRSAPPPPSPAEPAAAAATGDVAMGNVPRTDVAMGDADMTDAAMTDAAIADDGLDPALVAAAMAGIDEKELPGERPPGKKLSTVTIGWAALALVVAIVLGALIFAPSAVMSVLPGASRLYALFGGGDASEGLAFQSVRYGWTNEGGQTVLEVQGDVVNVSSSTVDVPTVVIALRDESGEEISEWTTEVGEQELGAGEHAPFLRQIPSPPSNVRSVKVRFAKAD
jgi:predicted Zn finger-like uncharacterized protein